MAAAKVKSKRTMEKKKAKVWYKVIAPPAFDSREIGEVVCVEEPTLMNRIISVSLMDISGKMSQANIYTSLKFRIKEIKGTNAYTELIGHELAPGYIRTLARRRKSILHTVRDIPTKDDKVVRVKLISVTRDRVSETMRKNLRVAIETELTEATANSTYYELMQDVLFGKLSTKVFNKLKQITPMSRVEFRKTELKEQFE
jgi:ribosomal protein S3AE